MTSTRTLARPGSVEALLATLGPGIVRTDPTLLDLYGQDIWSVGRRPAAVLSPADTAELCVALIEADRLGLPVAPRGGGMSYTGGYASDAGPVALIDLSRMDRVLHVDAGAMTVTVQAGCTWKTLLEALKPHGLRTPFWGPLSGVSSTIGGGLSQLNAVFGAGHWGTTSESVVGLTVALADGRLITTGARRTADGRAFYRHYGPDLTGLFCGDCGALGIKAEITLRLMRLPPYEAHGSFAFPDATSALAATAEISRAGVAADMFGFDPALSAMRLKRASLLQGVRALGAIATAGGGLMQGMAAAARTAVAGRGFLGTGDWSLHLTAEGRSKVGVADDMAEARRLCVALGGREVEASIPRVVRASPFTPLNNILGPDGERWVPVHGIVALQDAPAAHAAIMALFERLRPRFEAGGVQTGMMLTALSTNGLLIEPVFVWPEARRSLHEATVEPGVLSKLPRHAENAEVTELVAEARGGVVEAFTAIGAAHFQIGRTYPWLDSLDAPARSLIQAVKAELDPNGRMNPGVLGL
jgi:FAD/FMN-containing dehydrogenase